VRRRNPEERRRPYREFTEHEIRAALEATQGNVTLAARRLDISRPNYIGHATRKGIDLSALRNQIRARLFPVSPQPIAAADSGDRLPSARSLVAESIVDVASMGMAIHDLEAALEHERRINASLVATIEAIGAHMECAA
jgi:hypothetical protein